jgi:LPXTG-motif cell wall-anchored protein
LPSTGVRADILIVIGVILIGGALLILLYASRQRDEDEYIQ